MILRLVSREQLAPGKAAGGEKAEATTGKNKAWTWFTILPPILLSSHQSQLTHTTFPFPLSTKPKIFRITASQQSQQCPEPSQRQRSAGVEAPGQGKNRTTSLPTTIWQNIKLTGCHSLKTPTVSYCKGPVLI